MYDISLWQYPGEAIDCFADALRFLLRREETAPILKESLDKYALGEGFIWNDCIEDISLISDSLGLCGYTAQLVFCLNLLSEAEKKYAKQGLPKSLFFDTFDDLRVKNDECFMLKGVYGSFVARWFDRFFFLTRFGFGRLEGELAFYRGDKYLASGEPVINIHIPSKGKLTRKDLDQSYTAAASFFEGKYSRVDGKVPFVCDSWLLNPLNKKLGEKSGIVTFMSDYEILLLNKDTGNKDGWRIFNTEDFEDPSRLSEKTSLQRLYKAHLLAGGCIETAYGIALLEL